MTYKIGITSYDNDELLFVTKVGLPTGNMDLLYSVWGKSEKQSKDRAEELVKWLEDRVRYFGWFTKIN